ncbi:MAG: hypothetical protein IKQ10_01885 [Oscillospiraceae bacterium]|nr:hypothetical protein [Oscillospiraceae bacterium]
MDYKRLTLFAGHYGSGKTNLALNYAYWLRERAPKVTVADLDIVNPYFRTKDAEADLRAAGIELISSAYANSNVDVPAMPKETYALIDGRDSLGVLDIGGDDRGALALGRYVPSILAEDDYEMLFVVNRSRPLTRTAEDAMTVFYEIQTACGLPFTAIVNNTNLGLSTTAEDVLASLDYADEISRLTGLPVKMTGADKRLAPALKDKVENLFPISILELYYMEKEGTSLGKINF